MGRRDQGSNIPESLLDAADIVHVPILLSDIFLADWDTRPLDAHLSNAVNVILVEVDLEGAKVTSRPLSQTPFLNNLLGRVKLDELASNVAIKDSKLATHLGTVKLTRRATCECGNALRVRKCVIELLRCGAEFVRRRHCGGIDSNLAGSGGSCGGGNSGMVLAGRRVNGRWGEATGRINSRGVLEVLSVLSDQGASELG